MCRGRRKFSEIGCHLMPGKAEASVHYFPKFVKNPKKNCNFKHIRIFPRKWKLLVKSMEYPALYLRMLPYSHNNFVKPRFSKIVTTQGYRCVQFCFNTMITLAVIKNNSENGRIWYLHTHWNFIDAFSMIYIFEKC